ncbi:MAG: methyltransferase domain-containing protein [Clostridia bacterium]
MLICPKCKEKLTQEEKRYLCQNGHSFDISKSSHINLLISSKSGDDIGDNKEMVRARTNFLSRDYYKPLADKLCEIISVEENISYLDCACGQGYYTKKIANSLKNSRSFATDISKHAVIYASKQDKNTQYFVGSVFDLPIQTDSIDALTSIFAPTANEEFARILSDKGRAIIVVAGNEHLFELKAKVYDNPYKNDEDKHDFHNFVVKDKIKVTYKACIEQNEDIKHLFHMTPYAFKTSKEDALKLDSLENLEVTLDFAIFVLEKNI